MKKLFLILVALISMYPLIQAQNTSVSPGHIGIGGEDTTINSLPVKLIILTVRPQSEDALLNWQTASEINSDYFEVERTIRCNPCNEQSWSALGRVKSSGNSNDIRAYQFVDTKLKYLNPQPQTVYYRLKQVDKDGTVSYSNIIALDIKTKSNTITLFPLPINNILTAISSNSESINELSIFDMSGKELMKTSGGQIDVSTLAQGMYVVRVATDKQTYVQKITK